MSHYQGEMSPPLTVEYYPSKYVGISVFEQEPKGFSGPDVLRDLKPWSHLL